MYNDRLLQVLERDTAIFFILLKSAFIATDFLFNLIGVEVPALFSLAIPCEYFGTLFSLVRPIVSCVQIEEWKPIFDKFDVEADGKSDGKIPLQKFAEILDCDPIWKVT